MFQLKVSQYIGWKTLFELKDRILVTLSGGADSVALLRVLIQLGYECEAAHCNFHLRAEESDKDEAFVRALCQKEGIPCHVKQFQTLEFAQTNHLSIEMAARDLRYQWFEELRLATGCDHIAVAHHRDDSVETVLLNLIRGTGINGLKGIRPQNERVVRPLLCVSRKEILDYLKEINQSYVTDSTNLQDDYTRNKIRLNILPEMEAINPSVKESIASTAERLSGVAAIYQSMIESGKLRVMCEQGISIPALLVEPSPASLLYEILYPLGFNASQIKNIEDSLSGTSGRRFYTKEWLLIKDRNHLLLTTNETKEVAPTLKIESIPYKKEFKISTDKQIASLDAGKLHHPLTIRKWRAGDYFIPFGMKGKKKVNDYLTDCKFSLLAKEQVYVVCCGEEIVWVIGERIDNRFRIDDHTKEILLLTIHTY